MEQTRNFCTVVSIVPTYLNLDKIGIFPNYFRIPAADDDKPEVLHVEDCSHYIYLGVERGYMKARDLAQEVCKSIVEDFKRAIICVEPGAEPGLFWVSKKVEKANVERECAQELKEARQLQQNWYRKIIEMADDDWTRSGHMHRAVSDLQRLIAKKLKLEREWVYVAQDEVLPGTTKCPACMQLVDKQAIICPNCKLILKPDEHKKLTFAA